MGGLVGYGAYVPYYRLERTRIAGVLGSGGGRRAPPAPGRRGGGRRGGGGGGGGPPLCGGGRAGARGGGGGGGRPPGPALPVLAEVIGQGCATAEFGDRWRAPGAAASRVWE